MLKGIDASSFQKEIDWNKVKSFIDFTILRCGYGDDLVSQDDPYFERNSEACSNLGIPFGVYLYSYATTQEQIESEVKHTLRLIKDKQLFYPVFIDVEDKTQLALPKEELVTLISYYCEKLEKAGYYVGIYASLSVFNHELNDERLNRYDKWVAQWNDSFSYAKPAGMWQYSDQETIPGIDTKVDGDIAFYDFSKIIYENHLNKCTEQKKEDLSKDVQKPEKPSQPLLPPTVKEKYTIESAIYIDGPIYKNSDATELFKDAYYLPSKIKQYIPKEKAPYQVNQGFVQEESIVLRKDISFFRWLILFIRNVFFKKKKG